MTAQKKNGYMGVILLVCVCLFACSLGMSHFKRSYTVSQAFETKRLLEKHHYYHNGPAYSPDAVVAVKDGYTLKSPLWHRVEMDSGKLRHMVDEMLNNPGSEFNTEPNGAYILNDSGEVIGAWYSVWALPILTFKSVSEFAISQPPSRFPDSNKAPLD